MLRFVLLIPPPSHPLLCVFIMFAHQALVRMLSVLTFFFFFFFWQIRLQFKGVPAMNVPSLAAEPKVAFFCPAVHTVRRF